MPRALRSPLALNGGLFALLGWLYGADLLDALRARSVEVAALSTFPNVPMAVVTLLAGAAALIATVVGVRADNQTPWRGYRLMPIVVVVALFVDALVLPSRGLPFSSAEQVRLSLAAFSQRASTLSDGSAVVTDAAVLEPLVAELGAPPYLLRGQPRERWGLVVRRDCAQAAEQPEGSSAATLVYCVSRDRSTAWVSVVGLPTEQRFGAAAMVSEAGRLLVAQVILPGSPPQTPQVR